jgi:hypothetical protein
MDDPYVATISGNSRVLERPLAKPKPNLPHGFMAGMDVLLVPVSLFWVGMSTCMCGHLDWMAAVVIIPAFLILVSLAISGGRNWLWERCLNYLSLLVLVLPLGKMLFDILWNGHTPLLR